MVEEEVQRKVPNYDYLLLLEELNDGREVEFKYENSLFKIYNVDQIWYALINGNRLNNYYITPVELVEKVKALDGRTIKEIFQLGLFSHKSASYHYELLLKDLSIGREIEFQYKDVLYGICHFAEGWVFVVNNKNMSDYLENPSELMQKVRAHDGKTIKEIFNKQLYANENFYIL